MAIPELKLTERERIAWKRTNSSFHVQVRYPTKKPMQKSGEAFILSLEDMNIYVRNIAAESSEVTT